MMTREELIESEEYKMTRLAMDKFSTYSDEEKETIGYVDGYEDGYKACWEEISKPKFCEEDEKKMDKLVANEYAAIAYNALAELVINANINPATTKPILSVAMRMLYEYYECPI